MPFRSQYQDRLNRDLEYVEFGEEVILKPDKRKVITDVIKEAEENEKRIKEKREKVKQAIALEYDPEDNAPRVIASGRGMLAEKIIEKAKEAEVPVHRDDKLAETLSRLEIGDMIPPELYEAVAEILVFVDSMDKIRAKIKK